nr:hypothetical protein [Candidatus Sigynarchaeota archaeon]
MKRKISQGWLSLFKRFGWVAIISTSVMILSITAFALIPGKYIYTDGDWNYKFVPDYDTVRYNVLFDPHSHTLQSGGVLTPKQNIEYHIAMGYNACVVTDKLTGGMGCWQSTSDAQRIAREQYDRQIKVLVGIEWGSNRGHFNIILPPNITNSTVFRASIPNYGSNPSDDQILSFINATHALGGIVIIDHLLYSLPIMPTHPSRQQLFDWGVDYIEVINAADFDQDSNVFCRRTGMGMIAATGMHVPEKDKIHGWTLVNVSTFTEQAVFDELKGRRASMLYQNYSAPYNATHELNPWYIGLRPFIQLGEVIYTYFPGGIQFDGLGFTIVLANVILWFVVIEGIRFSVVFLKCKIGKNKQNLEREPCKAGPKPVA